MQTWIVVTVSVAYLGLLFGIAYVGDRRAEAGRSVINSGTVYALSLAVYATSWTYYGSVGRAATAGVSFLPVYLGPTLMFVLGWLVLRRIIRISRRNRLTSLADFVSARYGKSAALGGLVTIIAVVGIVPYISLQLKAISDTFELIRRHPDATTAGQLAERSLLQDPGLYATLLLAAFVILFGTRHLDATERHEGMVAAIAFESVVKLAAFLAAGVFVTFGLFGGFGDLFSRAEAANLRTPFTLGEQTGYGTWVWLMVISMLAVLLLPRQWQIGVVENVDEGHVKRAMWLLPLYLLAINIFVVPIATAGLLHLGSGADADTYVLMLPLSAGQETLAMFVFIGGLSAGTGMIIVETVALSMMVSNSLIMPMLLRGNSRLVRRSDLSGLILGIRRVTIVLVLLLGYGYVRLAGEGSALVSIGLVSFAAVAQFAPGILGGLFWKGGTRRAVFVGLVAGFTVWIYTLLLPSFAAAGLLPATFLRDGPLGIEFLRPHALFGMDGMDPLSNAMFWSTLVNVGAYVGISLASRPDPAERAQAEEFVEALTEPPRPRRWQTRATVSQLRTVLERFLGRAGAERALRAYPGRRDEPTVVADPALVHHVETLLGGSVGAASARLVVASVAGEEQFRTDEVIEMLDEASQVATLEERQRIARELHDSVSQALFSMTLHTRAVELAIQREGADPAGRTAQSLAELRNLTQEALAQMRALIFQLRTDALHNEGLVATVRNYAAAVAAWSGIDVAVSAPQHRLPLDERAEQELYRVVQEALGNSVRHARPSHVDIRFDDAPLAQLRSDGTLLIEITDNGRGFDPRAPRPGHHGLDGMHERIEDLGGRFTIDSHGGSTTVRAVLPGILRPWRPSAAPPLG